MTTTAQIPDGAREARTTSPLEGTRTTPIPEGGREAAGTTATPEGAREAARHGGSALESSLALGIDIGGTGIKGGLVDVDAGTLQGERHYIPTPQPPTPEAIAEAVLQMRDHFAVPVGTPVGVAFPAIVRHGVVRNATNIDPVWIGLNAAELFEAALGSPVTVLNDADAAGLAEMARGAGQNAEGVTLVVTLGTGIGSALFLDGRLLPNTEFGHLSINGIDCCPWASAAARVREGLSWAQWISRLQDYLSHAEFLMWPDLIIIGGGISHDAEQFLPLLQLDARVVRATLENDAGIIGAACEATALSRLP